MDTSIAVIGTECKQSDTLSDGLNEETWHEDDTPHIDFCRRHLVSCVVVGATSLIIVTATIITCAVVIGYKISKESISMQYGTVVFKTIDNSSVLEKISIHEDGLTDIRVSEKALVIFDYPHFLMVLHFAKFEGVCFLSQINDTWTHVFGLTQKYEEIKISSLPSVIWFKRNDAIVDRNMIPYSIHKTCQRHSYWIKESKQFKNFKTDAQGKCGPICVTFCLSRKSPCTKVCLQNPCKNSVQAETLRLTQTNITNKV